MPDSAQELIEKLTRLTQPGIRGRLSARGLARGMIWRNGEVPEDAPKFSSTLTVDLLDYGYGLLAVALRAKELDVAKAALTHPLVVAAEAIESAVRKGPRDPERDFNLFVAAAVFHLAQFGARSFCLLNAEGLNLSNAEQCVRALIRGRRRDMRHLCAEWLENEAHRDDRLAARLSDSDDGFRLEDAERVALTGTVMRALGVFDTALSRGTEELVDEARERLSLCSQLSQHRGYVPMWWTAELTYHLVESIWETSLHALLSPAIQTDNVEEQERWSNLRSRFITLLAARPSAEVQLWPSQTEAAQRATNATDDLIVALPTSAGKTRVAELCILRCLASGKRVVYVTPLRALSAQVERGLAKTFVPLGFSVTSLYGASGIAVVDIGNLQSAEIVVATPEKLDFAARQAPEVLDNVGLIVLDEGHMIGLSERELHYEVLVQRLLRRPDASQRRLVCLSAVFSEGEAFNDFTEWLRRDNPGRPVVSDWRPTRQRVGVIRWVNGAGRLRLVVDEESPYLNSFVVEEPPKSRRRNAFPQDDEEFALACAKAFLADGQSVLLYCPQRSSVDSLGEAYLKLHRQGYLPSYLPDDIDLTRALAVGVEWLGEQHLAIRCLRLGVVVHHGTMPRAFLTEVEELLSNRKLRLAIASPTLAQGIDLSSSVLIFRSIHRGGNVIPAAEYANVVGRAGRAFVDLDGVTVYPIFDSETAGRRKANAFTKLQREAASRIMESGILLLIRSLLQVMTTYTGSTFEEILEYVTNTTGPWTLSDLLDGRPAPNVETSRTFDPDAYFSAAIEELDIAILGSVDDPGVESVLVAEALDAALQTSFWSRRLNRLTTEDVALQRSILHGRARWIWDHTSVHDRKGFYSAGLGFAAGSAMAANLEVLIAHILRGEALLQAGAADEAAQEVEAFADIVFEIGPFNPGDRPVPWRGVLASWLKGEDLPPLIGDPNSFINFIQDAVVYRLVWAIEATRVQAITAGMPDAELLTGRLALGLTYGLPTIQASIIAQAGLRSRRMVLRLLERFPGVFTTSEGFQDWFSALPHTEVADSWADNGERAIWMEFSRRWADVAGGRWRDTTQSVVVNWMAPAPAAGEEVRLLHNRTAGVTAVYDIELTRLGALDVPIPDIEIGAVNALVEDTQQTIRISRFGA